VVGLCMGHVRARGDGVTEIRALKLLMHATG
jgi:hypothetical protein